MSLRDFGNAVSDRMTRFLGSWQYILGFNAITLTWIAILGIWIHIDPFPFILLNLCFSWISGNMPALIMMSQNRQEAREKEQARLRWHEAASNAQHQQRQTQVLIELAENIRDINHVIRDQLADIDDDIGHIKSRK